MENEDPAVIREQIEATRERIADTAEALAYKSDVPARVKDEVNARVDTAKAVASDAAATVSAAISDATAAAKPHVTSALNTASDAASEVADRVDAAAEPIKPYVASVASTVADFTDKAKTTIADVAAKTGAGGGAGYTDLTGRTRDDVGVPSGDRPAFISTAKTFIANNPVAVALGTIALGFLVGLRLPGGKTQDTETLFGGRQTGEPTPAKATHVEPVDPVVVDTTFDDATARKTPPPK